MEVGSVSSSAPPSWAPAPQGDVAGHRPLRGVCLSHASAADDDSPTAPRAGWEDAIALMARNTVVSSESLQSCTSTASMKVKNVKKLSVTRGHFPRLAECAHFHYETVDFGSVQLSLSQDQGELTRTASGGLDSKELAYLVQICCQGQTWIVKRSYEDFRVLDKHLHLCIYDRRFSKLAELPRCESLRDLSDQPLSQMLTAYLSRLSAIADNKINCGPALTWMEIDNKGNHLLVHDESSINIPAVAAAHVIKRYTAQAPDELSFEVGDIVSVIDIPPTEDTGWWKGKHHFQVGFFPGECVELISEKVPPNMTASLPKPVCKKHGKLITFLRSFVKSRPTKQKLQQCGILRERVFGCDLGEHLLNSAHDVPQVIKSCAEFIEKHGVVDGIYRLSGVASNIQKLRHEFDSEHVPNLSKEASLQDIHSVGSLCKLYFRELPNPLLTYQLYDRFSDAVSAATDDERLVKIHDVIQQLPPPHYRTLEFLMRHLARMATFSNITNMHCKNLAIVWAPNLLRSRQIESACFGGTSAFMEVRVQSVVVEFILSHVEVLFSCRLSTLIRESAGHGTVMRPKSLMVYSPSTKLLTLEEAQARTQTQLSSPLSPDSKYIEVGEGPGALQGKFHTILELPADRKKVQTKVKKSPVASWRSFFNMGKSSTAAKRKLLRHPSEPNEIKTMALPGGRGDTGTMRSAKSEESLSSHNHEGVSGVYRARRPRSTSDALSTSFSEELLNSQGHGGHRGPQSGRREGGKGPTLAPPPADAQPIGEEHSSRLMPADGGSRKKRGGGSSDAGTGQGSGTPRDRDALQDTDRTSAFPATVRLEGSQADVAVETTVTSLPIKSVQGDVCPSSTLQGEAETREDPARSVKHAGTGAVMFDCSPGLVRSVSLITAQPAGRSAARMLALALAESAEQASRLRKRGSSEPPTPLSPLHLQDPLSLLQVPPAPRKDPVAPRGTFADSSSAISAGNCTDSSSPQSTCACRGSESGLSCSEGRDIRPAGRETSGRPRDPSSLKVLDSEQPNSDQAPVRENVRHIGVGTDTGPGLDPETQPCETLASPLSPSQIYHGAESHSALATLLGKQAANASNFRAILAEAAMPSSVQDVVPHAPSSGLHYGPEDGSVPRSVPHDQLWSSPLRQSAAHHHPDYPQNQADIFSREHYSTLTPRSLHLSIKYKGQPRSDYSPGRGYGNSGPRYPPMDGAAVYPTIRRVRSMHAPPEDRFFVFRHPSGQNNPYQSSVPSDIHHVRPYFEDGKVQYRYRPFPDSQQSSPDVYRVNGHGYNHSYTTRRVPVPPGRGPHEPGLYPSFSRDVRPLSAGKDGAVCDALDVGLAERRFGQSIRQGTVWNKRLPDVAVAQAHLQRGPQRCQGTNDTRIKSDSAKDILISTEGADGKYRVTMVQHSSPEHPLSERSEPDVCPPDRADRWGSRTGAKASLMLKQSCSMLNYPQLPARQPSLQKEYSCPDFKRCDSHDAGGVRLHQDRLMFQTLAGCTKPGRQLVRLRSDSHRSERSQSMRAHHQQSYAKRSPDHEHRQAHRRTRTCSMYVPSRSHYRDACGSAKHKGSRAVRAGPGVWPNYGCMSPHGSRLGSAGLGPRGFLKSELWPETQVYAE